MDVAQIPAPATWRDTPYEPICGFESWAAVEIDTELFEHLKDRVAKTGEAGGSSDIRWAQDRILRASAFETGAVEDLYAEGATYSVAMEVDGWQGELANSGDGAELHFEDQLAAYVLIREWSDRHNGRPILEVDVRELHRIATRSQKTYPVQTPNGLQHQEFHSGVYKDHANRVINRAGRVIHYAPVEDVPPEMEHLISTIRSDAFRDAHPVVQSAYIHWAIAHIHPFADGNGRMARVMGSLPLLQNYGIPLVVFAGRKRGYLQALEAADHHDHQEMVNYVSARASETMSWLAELLEGATAQEAAEQSLADIAHLLSVQAGKLETRKEAAERLRAGLADAIEKECVSRFRGTPVIFNVETLGVYVSANSFFYSDLSQTYKQIDGTIQISLSVQEVAHHETSSSLQVGYTDDPRKHPVVAVPDVGSDPLYFSLEDCSPDLSVGTELRLRSLASTLISHVTKQFEADLVGIFKQHGWLPTKPS